MPNLLVVGDLIIDETYYVDTRRVSPEAPVLSVSLLDRNPKKTAGGAGFAAAWAASQNITTYLLTACTSENRSMLWFEHNVQVLEDCEDLSLNVTKTRFIDEVSGYHVFRLDNDDIADKPSIPPFKVIKQLGSLDIDACVISDYCKGFFTPTSPWHSLITALNGREIPTIIDSKSKSLTHWINPNTGLIDTWLKLNRKEMNRASNHVIFSGIPCPMDKLVVTEGSEGATMYNNMADNPVDSFYYPPSSQNIPVPDVTGCGDIFDVAFILAIADGRDPRDALKKAVDTASKWTSYSIKDKFKCLRQRKG